MTEGKKKVRHQKVYKVHIQHTDGSVARITSEEAYDLVEKNRAKFISNTLFKAAKAGISIKKLSEKERRDDASLKKNIREQKKQPNVAAD